MRAGVVALILLACAAAAAAQDALQPTAFLSREVRPYLVAVEALEQALARSIPRLYAQDGAPALEAALARLPQSRRAVIAVGPEAVEIASHLTPPAPTLALMVVDPPPWPPQAPPLSAVVLRLPIREQLRRLQAVFPNLQAAAVAASPDDPHAAFLSAPTPELSPSGLRLISLSVSDPPDWSRLLDRAAAEGAQAVLFLPHPSLAATAVVRHVTAESVLRRLMPVGYNRLFLDAGAGAAFLVDAAGVGRLGAAMLTEEGFGTQAQVRLAPYRVVIKPAVLRHLGIVPADPLPEGAEAE